MTGQVDIGSWVERTVRIPDVPECRMMVDAAATDPVSRLYLSGPGVWANSYLIRVMTAMTKAADRVLDVGSFNGEFALAAGARGCDVVAVEASPGLAALITASAELNPQIDMRVVNAAAGDRPGTVRFKSHGPWGQVVNGGDGDDAIDSVPQVTLDDLVDALGWDRVDFVKIDIEGSEMRAFAGAPRLFGSPDAPALLFESNISAMWGTRTAPSELLKTVEDFGYSLYRVTQTEILPADHTTFQPETVSDYVALKGKTPADFGLGVREPLTIAEMAARVVGEAAYETAAHRVSIGWQLRFAPQELRDRPEVQKTLTALAADADEHVRAAAAGTLAGDTGPGHGEPEAPMDVGAPVDGVLLSERVLRRGAELRIAMARQLQERDPQVAPEIAMPSGPSGSMALDVAAWLSTTASRHPRLSALVKRSVRLLRRLRGSAPQA